MGIGRIDDNFDEIYNWNPGENRVLEEGEQGYQDIKQKVEEKTKLLESSYGLSKAEIAGFLSATDIEFLDGQKGFSYFERQLVDHLLQGRVQDFPDDEHLTYNNVYNVLQVSDNFAAYWSILGVSLLSMSVEDRTWEAVMAMQERFENGMYLSAHNQQVDGITNPFVREGFEAGLTFRKTTPAFFLSENFSPRVPLQDLMTSQDLMFEGLYGDMGAYEVGSFENAGVYSAYVSHVDRFSPVFGELFAARVFSYFQELKQTGKWQVGETFTVYEHGGGDGKLAIDFLTFVESQAKSDGDWDEFWQHLHFVGMEIAQSAYDTQKSIESQFPGKFTAALGNAITDHPEQKGKGVVISSLLIDSFPQHKVVNENGQWQVDAIGTDSIRMAHFGDFVFYAGLGEYDLASWLPRMGYDRVEIKTQDSLWEHHPSLKTFPDEMLDEMYLEYLQNKSDSNEVLTREQFDASMVANFSEEPFKILFATF